MCCICVYEDAYVGIVSQLWFNSLLHWHLEKVVNVRMLLFICTEINSINLCVWHLNLDSFHSASVSVFSVAFYSFQLNPVERRFIGMTVKKNDNVSKQVTGLLLPRNVT